MWKQILNIYNLNVAYILCGFAFMTTLYSNPSASILYRAIGILLPVICLLKNRFKFEIPNDRRFKTYLGLLLLYSIVVLYTLILGKYADYHGNSKNLALLFLVGVMWIPLIGYFSSTNQVNYDNTVILIFFVLLFVIAKGYIGITDQVASTSGRFNLNASQSTLTFGDKGMMLSIASAALLLAFPKKLKSFFKIFFIIGVVLGIMAAMKGGSRGPMVSGVVALLFLLNCASKNIKKLFLLIFLGLISIGAAVLKTIQNFAPALYERIMLSILKGDTSGRDSIFSEALNSQNFLFGGDPIMLNNDGFFGFHNAYITFSMGIGIIPTIVLIIVLLSLFFSLYKKNKNNKMQHHAGEFFIYGLFIFYIFRGITGVNIISTNEFNLAIFISCYICSKRYKLQQLNY